MTPLSLRIHIPIGIFILVSILLLTLCTAAAAIAQPVTVPVINAAPWTVSLVLSSDDPAGADVAISNCVISGGSNPSSVHLVPHGTRVRSDWAGLQCGIGDEGLATVKVTSGSANVYVLADRANENGTHAEVRLEPLPGAMKTDNELLSARIVRNDAEFDTYFALFNASTVPLKMNVTFYDEDNHKVGPPSSIDVPATFGFITVPGVVVHAGRAEIRFGCVGAGGGSCSPRAAVSGYAFVNHRAGGSALAVPLSVGSAVVVP